MTLLMLAALAAAQPLPVPDCAIARTVYRLHGAPEFTAGFARQDRRKVFGSNLVLWLRTPHHTYWFSMRSPNGYGGVYLDPDIDPRRSVRLGDDAERDVAARIEALEIPPIAFDLFRVDFSAYETPPQASDPPPALLFGRALGPNLWYDWTRLAGGDARAVQEAMPIGLFEPAGCGDPPPES